MTTTAWPTELPPAGRADLVRRTPAPGLTSPRAWAELVYAVVDLVPAIAFFTLLVTLLSVGLGLVVIYAGVPILVLALLVARFGGLVQRSLAAALLELPTEGPPWTAPRRPGPIAAIGAVVRDPAHWRAVAYFCVKIGLAPLTFTVAVAFYSAGLGALTYPAWRLWLPAEVAADGTVHHGTQLWPGFFLDTWPAMIAYALLGLGVLWCAPRVVGFLTTVDRILVVTLLGRRG
ncbi:sensor domain-containing protein [Nakamurella sp.]|uniref:sensor domain-containing protein n=1 Tax=Nakamurella sp. TaxID=1869182 RepID=UPI003B3AE5C9